MLFIAQKHKKELDVITIKINKSKRPLVPNVNYLGIVLDEFFSWDAHVNSLCKKLLKLMVFRPNSVIMFHKRLIFWYISPCFTHLFYLAPYHGNFPQKPIFIESSFCKRNVYANVFLFTKITVILCLKILSYLNFMIFWNQRS